MNPDGNPVDDSFLLHMGDTPMDDGVQDPVAASSPKPIKPKKKAKASSKSSASKASAATEKPPPTSASSSGQGPVAFTINLETQKGLKVNKNGGVYQRGKSFSFTEKVRIANTYVRLLREKQDEQLRLPPECRDKRVTVSKHTLAHVANCSPSYAQKIIQEIKLTNKISDNAGKRKEPNKGYGSRTFTEEDKQVLLAMLSVKGDSVSLKEYQQHLQAVTGTKASLSTICHFLKQHKRKTDEESATENVTEQLQL